MLSEEVNIECEKYLKRLLATYKLVHAQEIEDKKQEILRPKIRQDIYSRCTEARSAKEIAKLLNTKPQNVNYHLNVLTDCGLLDFDLKGSERIFYQVL